MENKKPWKNLEENEDDKDGRRRRMTKVVKRRRKIPLHLYMIAISTLLVWRYRSVT